MDVAFVLILAFLIPAAIALFIRTSIEWFEKHYCVWKVSKMCPDYWLANCGHTCSVGTYTELELDHSRCPFCKRNIVTI